MRVEQNETTTFSFHGPAVDDGHMEIRDFVEAARGFTELLEIASKQHGTPVSSIKIRNIERGSFVASLLIEFDTSLLEAIRDVFTSENATAIANLSGVTALLGSAIVLFKKFKKHKPDKVENHGNEVTVYDSENIQIFNGSTSIYNIAIDPRFGAALETFTGPLKNPGVESAKLFPSDPKATVEFDRCIFKELNEDAAYRIVERELELKVLRIAFDQPSWRFYAYPSDGTEFEFAAEILDKNFLDRANLASWGSNDYIRAVIKEWIPLQSGKHRRFQILRVTEIIHQPALEIFDGDPRSQYS